MRLKLLLEIINFGKIGKKIISYDMQFLFRFSDEKV